MKKCLLGLSLALLVAQANAATYTVINTNDAGAGSLRNAVGQANANPGADTINFSVTGTITLTTGQLAINGPVSIVGPGAGSLTISGNDNNRVFSIFENVADVCATPGSDFTVTISGLTLTNGRRSTNQPGGAMYSEKTLALNGVVIQNSEAKEGGGLAYATRYASQSLTIDGTQFLGNIARPFASTGSATIGGAISVFERCATSPSGVSVTVNNSVFSDNHTQPGSTFLSSGGGAIWVSALVAVTITDTRIVGNSVISQNPVVPGQNNRGGGVSVQNAVSLTIERSEFSNNTADRNAGLRLSQQLPALQTAQTALAVSIVNSTFSQNTSTADASVLGTNVLGVAAIGVFGNVALQFYNSTVAGNTSVAGLVGGIGLDSGPTVPESEGNTLPGTLSLYSTIFSGNTGVGGPADIAITPAFPALTVPTKFSLIGTVGPNVTVVGPGNIFDNNPLLDPIAFNGGPTRTMAIIAGSPAIQTGENQLNLATDQRGPGFPRETSGWTDMGAYQSGILNPSQQVPTLTEYALVMLALMLAGMGAAVARRRR